MVFNMGAAEAGARGWEPDEAHVWEEQEAVEEEWRPFADTPADGGEAEEPESGKRWDGQKHSLQYLKTLNHVVVRNRSNFGF